MFLYLTPEQSIDTESPDRRAECRAIAQTAADTHGEDVCLYDCWGSPVVIVRPQ